MGRIIAENKHTGKLYPVDSKAIYRVIYEVVDVLPTENIKTSVIYCVPIIGKENEYDMFLYIDSNWVSVGSGSIDLSDYYTKEEVDDIVADISTLSFKIVQEKPVEDIETNIIYLIPKSGSETGNIYEEWIYIDKEWELLGATDIDLSNYMTLAPLNPTAEQIAALPSGQLYSDVNAGTVNIKNGVQLLGVLSNGGNPEYGSIKGELGQIAYYYGKMYQCFGRNAQDTAYVWELISYAGSDVISARATTTGPSGDYVITSSTRLQEVWELFTKYRCVKVEITDQRGLPTGYVCWITNVTGNNHENLSAFMLPSISATLTSPVYERIHFLVQNGDSAWDTLRLVTKYVYPPYEKYYTKNEIDQKGYLTLETLPIYDGTVI